MNRTLKFKVWCNNQNCFEYIDLYKDNFNIGKYINPQIFQFTGLTDCYGNNIYENDILKIQNSFQKWIVKYEIDKFVVDSIGNNFVLKKFNLNELLNLNIFNSKIEIIGNIIENPELLKEDEKSGIPSFIEINSLLKDLQINSEK
jgi:uncharacterized phage protein (TIGR01671 family)